TTVERTSDREVVVTRTVNGPARIVFDAFTKAELLRRWWVPKSMGMNLLSCEVDARVGGKYRLVFEHKPEPVAFFGTYTAVKPHPRLSWATGEDGEGASATPLRCAETRGTTLLRRREADARWEALHAAGRGAQGGMGETLSKLQGLLPALGDSPLS